MRKLVTVEEKAKRKRKILATKFTEQDDYAYEQAKERKMREDLTERLLPCPFCGGKADWDVFTVDHHTGEGSDFQVLCENDDCHGGQPFDVGYATKKLAIKAWNTRAGEKE